MFSSIKCGYDDDDLEIPGVSKTKQSVLSCLFGYNESYEYHGPLEMIMKYFSVIELSRTIGLVCKNFYLAGIQSYNNRKGIDKRIFRVKNDVSVMKVIKRLYGFNCFNGRINMLNEVFGLCCRLNCKESLEIIQMLFKNEKFKYKDMDNLISILNTSYTYACFGNENNNKELIKMFFEKLGDDLEFFTIFFHLIFRNAVSLNGNLKLGKYLISIKKGKISALLDKNAEYQVLEESFKKGISKEVRTVNDDSLIEIPILMSEISYIDVMLIKKLKSPEDSRFETSFLGQYDSNEVELNIMNVHDLLDTPNMQRFECELAVLTYITASPNIQNIQKIYGATMKMPRIGVVFGGREDDYLSDMISQKKNLSINQKLKILAGIVNGLKYLHDQNYIIHLEPAVICFKENLNPQIKISSLNKIFRPEEYLKTISMKWYRAPEYIFQKDYSLSIDIFCLSFLIYEFITYSNSFGNSNNIEELNKKISTDAHFRPVIKIEEWNNGYSFLIDIIQSCWDHNPLKRPSITSLSSLFIQHFPQSKLIFI